MGSTTCTWRPAACQRRVQSSTARVLAQLGATDAVVWQADARVDLAETRLLLGDAAGAEEAISDAVGLYRLKGSEVAAERARAVASLAAQGR